MPNVSTHRWTMCPPFEFELKYTLCSRLGGLDFLGALQYALGAGYSPFLSPCSELLFLACIYTCFLKSSHLAMCM